MKIECSKIIHTLHLCRRKAQCKMVQKIAGRIGSGSGRVGSNRSNDRKMIRQKKRTTTTKELYRERRRSGNYTKSHGLKKWEVKFNMCSVCLDDFFGKDAEKQGNKDTIDPGVALYTHRIRTFRVEAVCLTTQIIRCAISYISVQLCWGAVGSCGYSQGDLTAGC